MQLSYYCYDAALCAAISQKVANCFGAIDMSLSKKLLDNAHFTQTASPETADLIVFPYNIGVLIELMGTEQTEELLHSIPIYRKLQTKHVLFDYGDRTSCIQTQAKVFKVSLHYPYADNFFPIWYMTPTHVTNDSYVLEYTNNKYDICFVGTINNPLRKAGCISLRRMEKIRSYIDSIEGTYKDNIFYAPQLTDSEMLTRQNIFRNCIKTSKLSFCPPGIGPRSIRFYESLYYGRIPVVVCDSKTVFQYNENIDYSQFSLKIDSADIMHTGEIVYNFLSMTPRDALAAMSVRACRAYHVYFSNEHIPRYIYKTLCSTMPQCG